jgi:thiol-disulfide isomerase/thioredoxin
MKKILILNSILLFSALVHAQTIVEQPKTGLTTASNVKIEKMILSDTATVMCCHTTYIPGNWINIPSKTYLLPVGSKDTLYIKSAEGIPLNKQYTMPSSGEADYKLIFPAINSSVSRVDYGEGNEGGTWFIYDIRLKPDTWKSIIPEKISGNWFRGDNAKWVITLLDSVAIYKSQVWRYIRYAEKDGMGILGLKNKTQSLKIYLKPEDNNSIKIGESLTHLTNCKREAIESITPVDNTTFKRPVFRPDTAVYSGYVEGFSPRYGQRSGMIYVNSALSGHQKPYQLKIDENGYFRIKIPLTNPQMVMVNGPLRTETIFLEPGMELFHFMDSGGKQNNNLFMGDGARVNSDLLKVKNIYSFKASEMRKQILDLTPEQYKLEIENSLIRDLNKLKDFCSSHNICSKANQLWSMSLNYPYATELLSYRMNYMSTYASKNKLQSIPEDLKFKTPDSTYYSFLTPELIDNPCGVMTPDYSSFLNRFMNLSFFMGGKEPANTVADILDLMEKEHPFTSEEKELVKTLKEMNSEEMRNIQLEFQKNYGKQMNVFKKKYEDKLKILMKEKKGAVTPAMMQACLKDQKVELTEEENSMFEKMKTITETPLYQKFYQSQSTLSSKSNQFITEHREMISKYSAVVNEQMRKNDFQKMGISGLIPDLLNSQDFLHQLEVNFIPYSNKELAAWQSKISDPFIKNYLKVKNDETKAKIEASKSRMVKVNEVPKTDADKLFDAIMSKYKGKVVFVDFWATWCGPCRDGIERIKPLKEEMAKESIAFVYITNQTSPKSTYDIMIPDIKGEHYRLSTDEWNTLSAKFSISGIPHCVLVGKDGQVINSHLMIYDNLQLKKTLMKYIQQ